MRKTTLLGLLAIGAATGVQAQNLFVSTVKVTFPGNGTITYTGFIHEYSPTGTDLGTFATTGLTDPSALAFNSSGDLFAANTNLFFGTGNIVEFSPTGTYLGTFSSTGLTNPWGLVFNKSGDLFVSNVNVNAIQEYSPTGKYLGVFASTGLANPWGLAFNKSGDLFVANQANQTVHEFSPTGADLGIFAESGLDGPSGLAFNKSGDLFVSSQTYPSHIEEFSPTGVDLGTFATNALGATEGLAFNSSGDLFAANSGTVNGAGIVVQPSTIEEFSPTGTVLANVAAPDGDATYVAFGPSPATTVTPEGSSLTLLSVGLLPMAAFGWRRRRTNR